ncbi:hypothetical protein MKX01_004308 [Papaver californicum]|nr:hypothetical protein MKX01_004308 [Papaver californicum]
MDSSTSLADLKAFHGMDRRLYKRLVIDMGRDLLVCMQVIALWLYFEEIGYPNLIAKMENLRDDVVNRITEEAEYCFGFLSSVTLPPPLATVVTDMPVTNYLMDNKHISAMVIFENHKRAFQRVVNTVTEVLFRTFDDILLLAVEKQRNSQSNPRPTESQSSTANGSAELQARSSFFGVPAGMEQEARSSFFGVPAGMQQEARFGFVGAPRLAQEAKPGFIGVPSMVQQVRPGSVGVPGMLQVTRPSYAGEAPEMMQETRSCFVGVPKFRPSLPSPTFGTNTADVGIRPLLPAAPVIGGIAPPIPSLSQVIGHLGVLVQGHHVPQSVSFNIESSSSVLSEIGNESSRQLSDLNPLAKPWSPSRIELSMLNLDDKNVTKEKKQKKQETKEEKTFTPRNKRTMFFTFSHGYRVKEPELRRFLISRYGKNCIEKLNMQPVRLEEQSLWARIVFISPTTVGKILGGETKARFIINGKHVWARIFVDRDEQGGGIDRSRDLKASSTGDRKVLK